MFVTISKCYEDILRLSGFFTVNLDCDIRTGDRAQGASRALPLLFLEAYRTVSAGIIFPGGGDQTFLTCLDAQMALLAQFLVDDDMSLQMRPLLIWVMVYSPEINRLICAYAVESQDEI
jgi:hypothetical protein